MGTNNPVTQGGDAMRRNIFLTPLCMLMQISAILSSTIRIRSTIRPLTGCIGWKEYMEDKNVGL